MTVEDERLNAQIMTEDSIVNMPDLSQISFQTPYRVLARKYRPQRLSEVVGQAHLVNSLTQAIAQNRLPHAFILHGIRGVGKTTTARIIAKALNCIGPDGQGSPTPNPCGQCPSCTSITDDRHMDVVEMDAASHTGVDDIREVIDSIKYKAVQGRYKIYIIDEVHMLSKSAFNALLKTLEEPPPHVKFIFATTELKKVPDTVLSRCMRFDLSRISPKILFDYFKHICQQEAVMMDDEGLSLVVRAADGSARDGLSLLDQAISLCPNGHVTTEIVQSMLGLSDRGRIFKLFRLLMEGNISEALTEIRDLYACGGDTALILQNLLDLVYWVTCLKSSPLLKEDVTWPETDRRQGMELAKELSIPVLMRAWHVLTKGYEEVAKSSLPNQSVEMVLIRLAYLSDMPSAEDLLKLTSGTRYAAPQASSYVKTEPTEEGAVQSAQTVASPSCGREIPKTFEELVDLVACSRNPILYSQLIQDVHLVSFMPFRLEIRLGEKASGSLQKDLEALLLKETKAVWKVLLSHDEGQPTLGMKRKQLKQEEEEQAFEHPVVKGVLAAFPQATAHVVN
jgi:DNA polymerase-3 subunit gamma/tau